MEPRGGKRADFTAAVILGLTVPRRFFLTVIADRVVHVFLRWFMWRGGGTGGVADAVVAGVE